MKPNKHVIVLSDIQEKMLTDLEAKIGETKPNILRMALHYFHGKEKPEYVQAKQESNKIQEKRVTVLEKTGILPPLSSALAKAEKAGAFLCRAMSGTVTDDGYCEWKRYKNTLSVDRIRTKRMPLENVEEKDTRIQYLPSKNEYEEFCEINKLEPYETTTTSTTVSE